MQKFDFKFKFCWVIRTQPISVLKSFLLYLKSNCFHSSFGRIEDTKNTFWNWLTFSSNLLCIKLENQILDSDLETPHSHLLSNTTQRHITFVFYHLPTYDYCLPVNWRLHPQMFPKCVLELLLFVYQLGSFLKKEEKKTHEMWIEEQLWGDACICIEFFSSLW